MALWWMPRRRAAAESLLVPGSRYVCCENDAPVPFFRLLAGFLGGHVFSDR